MAALNSSVSTTTTPRHRRQADSSSYAALSSHQLQISLAALRWHCLTMLMLLFMMLQCTEQQTTTASAAAATPPCMLPHQHNCLPCHCAAETAWTLLPQLPSPPTSRAVPTIPSAAGTRAPRAAWPLLRCGACAHVHARIPPPAHARAQPLRWPQLPGGVPLQH